MNVAYCTDDNYVRHTYISLFSLLDKNQHVSEINIYIICDKVRDESKDYFISLVEQFVSVSNIRNISFVDFAPYKKMLVNALPWAGSMVAYGRLFLPYQESLDKILYLDCDTIINARLDDLYDIDISKYAVAGVQDNTGPKSRLEIGLSYDDRYINSGVLLMNLNFCRNVSFTQKCMQFIKENTGKISCFDQDVINAISKRYVKVIHPKFNVMTPMIDFTATKMAKFYELGNYYSDMELKQAVKEPVIIHFTGGFHIRPWFENSEHPFKNKYREYMDNSPWQGNYLPKASLGRRTETMIWTYKRLPFWMFIFTHRIVRVLKSKIRRVCSFAFRN